jgi:hypothetical protein
MATALTQDQWQQYQHDVLWNTLNGNPLLSYSPVSTLNQQLTTNATNLISATNEIVTKINTNNTSVGNFTGFFNNYIGNPLVDTDSWSKLSAIDTNVIKAVVKLNTVLGSLSGLQTTAKTDLVSAINEVLSKVGTGGTGTLPSTIDGGTF